MRDFPSGSVILVSISGGPDSIYLAWLLAKHFSKNQLHLIYFDHGLRPKPSIEKDRAAIQALCDLLHLNPYYSEKLPVTTQAKNTKNSIETTARALRRNALYTHAKRYGCTHIALGHHLDDHIETALFQLIRGTQSQLAGIKKVTFLHEIPIVRPLLMVSKHEIIATLNDHTIVYHSDETNDDIGITRNKIRHQLMPVIEELNPNYREKINQFLEYYQHVQSDIECRLKPALATISITRSITEDALMLPTSTFLSLPTPFLQQNWIRYAIKYWIQQLLVSPLSQLDAIHIISIKDLFFKETYKQSSVPAPFVVKKIKEGVRISLQNK
jgi:tRNA(Ile)-lysidine synthetase-like protein